MSIRKLGEAMRRAIYEIKLGIEYSDAYLSEVRYRKVPDTSEDLSAWRQYLNKWKVSGPFTIDFTALFHASDKAQLKWNRINVSAILRTRDREDFLYTGVHLTKYAPTARPGKFTNRWVRTLCRELYLHELDEWIKVDGKRIFDPHKGKDRP